MSRVCTLVVLCFLVTLSAAHAASRSATYSRWNVVGHTVRLQFLFPKNQAQRVVPTGQIPSTDAVSKYVLAHVSVSSASGSCPATDQGLDIGRIDTLSSVPGFYRFEVFFHCKQPGHVVMKNDVLFDLAPEHVDFARIQFNNGTFVQRLFTSARRQITLPASAKMIGSTKFLTYVRMGVFHVLRTPLLLAGLAAMLLLIGEWRDLARISGALGVGYLLSLAVSLNGRIAPNANLAAALLGVSMLAIAIRTVDRESGWAGRVAWIFLGSFVVLGCVGLFFHLTAQSLLLFGGGIFLASYLFASARIASPLIPLVPVALFGFVDGFNLFSDISVMQLSAFTKLPMLGGFVVGTFAIDVALVAIAAAVIAFLRWWRPAFTRPAMTDAVTTVFCGLGVFWLVTNLYV